VGTPRPDEEKDTKYLYSVFALYTMLKSGNLWSWPLPENEDSFWSHHFPGVLQSIQALSSDPNALATGGSSAKLQMFLAIRCYKFFVTEGGYIGLAQNEVRPGDLICDLTGTSAPAVLRPVESHYHLIGDCYVHGMMKGAITSKTIEQFARQRERDDEAGMSRGGDANENKNSLSLEENEEAFEHFCIR
jgi:hypothetical protein